MLTEGLFVADRYEIVGKVGTGGMSDVYKAKDHVLGRFVAIKVLKQEFSEDVNFVTKFRTEAQSAAGLEHPNIVNIYDVGSENGIYFIVMEYVEGITLKTYIEKKGQLSYKEAVSIAIQVGRGIEAAHNKHIIHRDIKPQNIIISTEGKVKVTDFGIAKAANNNTIHADVMGSVHYTSPEQARNGFVDGKSDIYSLGIVMYEMITGRVPFDGDTTVSIAIQHLQEEMTPPSAFAPGIPVSMEKIIMKCTQKNPDRRYDSISDLLVDLKKVLISPDEDFVTVIPVGQEKTRVIAREDVHTIQQETNSVYYSEDADDDEDDEEEDEEGFLNPKMEKAVTIMGIVAAVIIVAIIIVIIGNVTGLFRFKGGKDKNKGNDTQIEENLDDTEENEEDKAGEKVTMISVVGKTEDEARAALKGLGLGLKVTGTTASDEYAVGQIITQNINEGDSVEKNTTIEVTTCSGPGEFEAPGVEGLDETAADQAITGAGLNPKHDYAYNDTVEEGKVISQTPVAGSAVKKGDTITYIVSRGIETVKVPDVANKTEADARAELGNAGFNVEATSEYNDTIAAGNVIRQSNTGEYKPKGTTISLVVSLGKQSVYYSYNKAYKAPVAKSDTISDITADVTLYKAESEEAIVQETMAVGEDNRITVSAANIENVNKGTLVITWRWKESVTVKEEVENEDGEMETKEKTTTEEKSQTEEYYVSFQQQ